MAERFRQRIKRYGRKDNTEKKKVWQKGLRREERYMAEKEDK
jgi:hypothetical protein